MGEATKDTRLIAARQVLRLTFKSKWFGETDQIAATKDQDEDNSEEV